MTRAERRRAKRQKMRYVQNSVFKEITGKSFTIADPDKGIAEHESTIGEIVHLHLDLYDKHHTLFAVQYNQPLSPTETTAYNRIMEMLEKHLRAGDYYAFESNDFELVLKLIGLVCPRFNWYRHLPQLQDILSKATTELPVPLSTPIINEHSLEPVPVESRA